MAKSPQISLQRVPDGSRSQTAWAWTTWGTYAQAPYAFAALGQGPKGPELVENILGYFSGYSSRIRDTPHFFNFLDICDGTQAN